MRRLASFVGLVGVGLVACSSGSSEPSGDTGGGVDASADATTGPGPGGADAASPLDATSLLDSASGREGGNANEAGADAAAASLAHARADDAVQAMLLGFWNPGASYLDATRGTAGLTGYWTFAQAWDVVLDAVERHRGARFAGTLRTFYESASAAGWTRDYYDDESWMTLALLRAYDLTGEAAYLGEAKALYADIMAAWDTTCCGAAPGGLWWDRAHTQKATAANAGAVVCGARLYDRTKDPAYLAFAKQAYAYWAANMVDPATHQVIDHVTAAGQKTAWKFTYNEGLMIGAAAALAHASGDAGSLGLARDVASFMLASETASSPLGAILTDGTSASCGGDCMQFKGIGARYLAGLYVVDPSHADYRALLERSADAAWTYARDPASGLFGTDWGAALAPPAQLDAASSAAMTLSVVAALEGPAPPDPRDVYEAEEGVLHHVGLEASHAGFGGWGYVAGWNADGQSVDLGVQVAAAGSYDLTFHYAAGAGAASRRVSVNGASVVANQAFAATASWDAYAAVKVTVALPAGASTVSVAYDAASGSASYLNLDALSVAPH